jgi:hypothetical protein
MSPPSWERLNYKIKHIITHSKARESPAGAGARERLLG